MADAEFVQIGHDRGRVAERHLSRLELQAVGRRGLTEPLASGAGDGIGEPLCPTRNVALRHVGNVAHGRPPPPKIKQFVGKHPLPGMIAEPAAAVTRVFRAQRGLAAAEFQGGQRDGPPREIGRNQTVHRRRDESPTAPAGRHDPPRRRRQAAGNAYAVDRGAPANCGGPPAGLDTVAGVRACGEPSGHVQASLAAAKVSADCGSGISAPQAKSRAANSSRRPRRTASTRSASPNEQK